MSKRTKLTFLSISALFTVIFLIFSFLVHKDTFRNIDFNSMVYLQKLISRRLDQFLSIFTLLGSSEFTFMVVAVIFAALWFFKKHPFFGLSLYFLLFLIEIAGKLFVFHPKPPEIFYRYALNIYLPSSFIVNTDFSYPSGHISRSMFVACILAYLVWRRKKPLFLKYLLLIILVVLMIGMVISRVYLGEHWLSDIVGGLIVGAGVSSLALAFW